MSARFEEIDRRATPMGEISLRRRLHPTLLVDIYEVKLGDEHLMSSLFTEAETQLARLALAEASGPVLDGAPLRPHAVLVDIDHTPSHLLQPSHAAFYTPAGLSRLAEQLAPGGIFALWSDDPPDETFLTHLGGAFATFEAHIVTFPNPLTDGEASNTVYVARTAQPTTTG